MRQSQLHAGFDLSRPLAGRIGINFHYAARPKPPIIESLGKWKDIGISPHFFIQFYAHG